MESLLIKTIVIVSSTWLLLFFIFTGLGLLISRSFGIKTQSAGRFLASFWVGWAAAIFFLQLWHFFLPVDWRTAIIVSVIGISGLIWNYKDIWSLFRKNILKYWFFFIVLLIIALWLANNARLPPLNYDAGLYHLSAIKWITSFPIVPGLGNLHSRLAFNNSYFLYPALLEIGFWVKKSHHLANGLLVLVLFAQIFVSGIKLFMNKNKIKLYHLFYVLLLAPVIKIAGGTDISSPSPDLPVFILGAVVMAMLLAFLENYKTIQKEVGYNLFVVIIIAVAGITVKSSFFALGGVAIILAMVIWSLNRRYYSNHNKRRTLIWLIISAAIGLVPWLARSVFLSGYILYPIPFGSFPVDWRMPHKEVAYMANVIHRWGLTSGVNFKVTGRLDWFKPWLMRLLGDIDIMIPLALVFMGCVLLIVFRIRNKEIYSKNKIVWLFLLSPAASIIYWLFTAPDPRFAGSSFWILGIGMIVIAAGLSNRYKGLQKTIKIYAIIFLCVILSMGFFKVDGEKDLIEKIIKGRRITGVFEEIEVSKGWILNLGEEGRFGDTPSQEMNTYKTDSGLSVYIPAKGDQSWDGPLPNTPYRNPLLRLRVDEDMRYGFTVEKNK